MRMPKPVWRDLLLQPGRLSSRGEDQADALVGDCDDPVVGRFATVPGMVAAVST